MIFFIFNNIAVAICEDVDRPGHLTLHRASSLPFASSMPFASSHSLTSVNPHHHQRDRQSAAFIIIITAATRYSQDARGIARRQVRLATRTSKTSDLLGE
jgi:hypothetical protein